MEIPRGPIHEREKEKLKICQTIFYRPNLGIEMKHYTAKVMPPFELRWIFPPLHSHFISHSIPLSPPAHFFLSEAHSTAIFLSLPCFYLAHLIFL